MNVASNPMVIGSGPHFRQQIDPLRFKAGGQEPYLLPLHPALTLREGVGQVFLFSPRVGAG